MEHFTTESACAGAQCKIKILGSKMQNRKFGNGKKYDLSDYAPSEQTDNPRTEPAKPVSKTKASTPENQQAESISDLRKRVAENLIREEISKIKAAAGAPPKLPYEKKIDPEATRRKRQQVLETAFYNEQQYQKMLRRKSPYYAAGVVGAVSGAVLSATIFWIVLVFQAPDFLILAPIAGIFAGVLTTFLTIKLSGMNSKILCAIAGLLAAGGLFAGMFSFYLFENLVEREKLVEETYAKNYTRSRDFYRAKFDSQFAKKRSFSQVMNMKSSGIRHYETLLFIAMTIAFLTPVLFSLFASKRLVKILIGNAYPLPIGSKRTS